MAKNPVEVEEFGKQLAEELECMSICRKIFSYRTIQLGEVVRYDKTDGNPAFMVGEKSDVVPVSTGTHVYPSERTISEEIDLQTYFSGEEMSEAAKAGLEQVINQAKRSIIRKEDDPCMAMLRAATKDRKLAIGTLPELFFELKHSMEDTKTLCDCFLVNCNQFAKYVGKIYETRTVDEAKAYERDVLKLELVGQRELIMAGFLGTFDGTTQIITAADPFLYDLVPEGEVFALPPKEYLGGMPVRQPITSKLTPKSNPTKWTISEVISQVLICPEKVFAGKWVE